RRGETVEPVGLVDDTGRQRIGFFRRYVGVATGQRGRRHLGVVVPGVAHVDTAAGLVETLTQGGGTDVTRTRGTYAHLFVDGPVQTGFPGPDLTRTFVVGPAGGPGGFQGVGKCRAVQQGHVDLTKDFLHVVAAAKGAQRAEQYRRGVAVTGIAVRHETQAGDAVVTGNHVAALRDHTTHTFRQDAQITQQGT